MSKNTPPNTTQYNVNLSPCIGICVIAEDGLCEGCDRTVQEIEEWINMKNDDRLHLMDEVLPQRALARETR